MGEGCYFCLPLSPESKGGREGRAAAERRGSEPLRDGNFARGGGRGTFGFHQSPGACLRSPGRRGRLRRAAELTDESELFSCPGGAGSGGPEGRGGGARGGIAVPGRRGNFQGLGAARRARPGGRLAPPPRGRRGDAAKGAGASLRRGRRGPRVREGASRGPTAPRAPVMLQDRPRDPPPPLSPRAATPAPAFFRGSSHGRSW